MMGTVPPTTPKDPLRTPTALISGASIAGTEFVDADGTPVARFAAGRSDSGGATAELEILRGQLSRIIVDRTRDDTEYVFGDQIIALDDGPDGVTVTFAHGPARTVDLVVVAEGGRPGPHADLEQRPRRPGRGRGLLLVAGSAA